MLKKLMMVFVVMFSLVIFVNAQDAGEVTDNIEEGTNAVQAATKGDKAAEVKAIDAHEKAEKAVAEKVDKKVEKDAIDATDSVKKDMAEDEALGEAEAAIEKGKAEEAVEAAPAEEGQGFWSWLFGGGSEEEAAPAEKAEEVLAEKTPVEEPEVVEEKPAEVAEVVEAAPAEEPEIADEAAEAAPAEEGQGFWSWLFGGGSEEEPAVVEEEVAEEAAPAAEVKTEVKTEVKEEVVEAAEAAPAEEPAAEVEKVVLEEEPEVAEEAAPAEEGQGFWSWLFGGGSEEEAAVVEEEVAEEAAPAEEVKEEVVEVAEAAPEVEEAPAEEPAVVAGEAAPAEEGEKTDWGHKALYYIPNVFMDFTDTFSIAIGIGAESGLRLGATSYFQIGGNYGDTYFVEKAYMRKIGGGYNDGYIFQLGPLATEKRYIDETFGTIEEYIINQDKAYIPRTTDKIYAERIRDFWEVGVEGGWLIKFDFQLHPVEIGDFFTGLIGIDICDDDH